jgi:hypothetical protein
MLQQLSDLNALRGTTLGLEQLISAATHYECDIAESNNELLSVDDGDFNGGDVSQPGMSPLLAQDLAWGIGHWQPMTNATVNAKLKDPDNPGTTAASRTVTTAIVAKNTDTRSELIPPGGSGSMVVNGVGNDVIVSCGPLLTNASALYGIPVIPGGLYNFSCRLLRSTWTTPTPPPQARPVLGFLWFDSTGTFRDASTGTVASPFDSGAWQLYSFSANAPTVAGATYDAQFTIPVIWWIAASTWTGASGTPAVRPNAGRFVSMASLTEVSSTGGGVAALAPDVFLTLGVTAKKIGDPATSKIGIPGRTN